MMKKKGFSASEVVTPVIMLFVILISAYILYDFTLSKDAPSNKFADWVAKNFGYKDEYQSLDSIQTEINDIVTECSGGSSIISKIDNEIGKLEARDPGSVQDYMLRKFRDMRARAESSLKYCEAMDAFNSVPNFKGKDSALFQAMLAPINPLFAAVGNNANFQAVILAKEKIELISKMIDDCDGLKQEQCTPGNTKMFCVWTGKKGLLSNPCVPAVCEGSKEDLCRVIGTQTNLCYANYSKYSPAMSSDFQSCEHCEAVTGCSDYNDGKSCGDDPCKIAKGCYWEERDEPGLGHIQNCLSI